LDTVIVESDWRLQGMAARFDRENHPDPNDLLRDHVAGSVEATSLLLPLVYDSLRLVAARLLRAERAGHTLQPTALVHEAYLRLCDGSRIDIQGKTHFFALAARQMRFVLVNHARARKAKKRSGLRVTLNESLGTDSGDPLDVLALDEALTRLAEKSPRQSRVVELRCFAGLNVAETAAVLGVSDRTVKNDFRVAQAWLLRELGG